MKKICYYINEFNKVLSDQPSFYSGKRIKDWTAFITGEYVLIHGFIYLLIHDKLDAIGITMIAGTAFAIAGYQLKQIQNEKKLE